MEAGTQSGGAGGAFTRHTTRVGTLPTTYWRVAPKQANAPRVLFLHGVGASSHIWEMLAGFLSGTCDLIAVDFPGSGGSESRGVLTPAQLAAFSGDFLDALGLARVEVAVGHSLGGTVALEMALTARERLGGVMVLNAAPTLPWVPRMALKTPLGRRLSRLPTGPEGASRVLARLYLSWIFGDWKRVSPEVVEGYVQLSMAEGFNDRMVHQMQGLARHRRRRADLAGISVPASVVWGTRDPLFGSRYGGQLADAIPYAALHRLPTVGHCPAQEEPETVAGLIRELLSRIGRRPD